MLNFGERKFLIRFLYPVISLCWCSLAMWTTIWDQVYSMLRQSASLYVCLMHRENV